MAWRQTPSTRARAEDRPRPHVVVSFVDPLLERRLGDGAHLFLRDDAVAVEIDAAAERERLVAAAAHEVELAVALIVAEADPLDAARACV
jgi:hypothetical protein